MILNRIVVGARTYEQRRNRCGRRNCRTCYGPPGDQGRRPGHGPYWYLILSTRRGIRRVYIGKNLDTARFINPDGSINPQTLARVPTPPPPDKTPDPPLPF
jgi:hypothetical protein